TIINYSVEPIRRADLAVSVSYDTDTARARSMILRILQDHPKVLETPKPQVAITGMDAAAVHIAMRPWATNEDFWDMTSEVLEQVKTELLSAGIPIQPFVKERSV